MKSDELLDTTGLRKCCGVEPIFHKFSSIGAYGIECRIHGHIHCTRLHNDKNRCIEAWNSLPDGEAEICIKEKGRTTAWES